MTGAGDNTSTSAGHRPNRVEAARTMMGGLSKKARLIGSNDEGLLIIWYFLMGCEPDVEDLSEGRPILAPGSNGVAAENAVH